MILLLLILLILLFYLFYIANNRDYFSPSVIMTAAFIFSTVVAILNTDIWGVNLHINTVFVICGGLLAFFIGEFLVNYSKVNITVKSTSFIKPTQMHSIKVNVLLTLIIVLFMIVTLLWYFRYIYSISIIAGNTHGISQMLVYARRAVVDTRYNVSTPSLLAQFLVISECIGYIFLFIVIYNFILYKRIQWFYFIPIILYLAQITISTARIDYIQYLIGALIMYFCISYKRQGWNRHINLKIIAWVVVIIVLIFVGFRLLGTFTQKSSTRELWNDISIYSGSPICALDIYLNSPKVENNFLGQETLPAIYRILYRLGLTDIQPYNTSLGFVYFANGASTNIYTTFRRLIQDYGYIGMAIIQFLEGLFFGYITRKQKKSSNVGIGTILVSFMYFAVVEAFIDERFILNFVNASFVYHLIYFIVLYKLIVKNNFEISDELRR